MIMIENTICDHKRPSGIDMPGRSFDLYEIPLEKVFVYIMHNHNGLNSLN